MDFWEAFSMRQKLSYLSGYSTVDFYLLKDDEDLLALLGEECRPEAALEYINENY